MTHWSYITNVLLMAICNSIFYNQINKPFFFFFKETWILQNFKQLSLFCIYILKWFIPITNNNAYCVYWKNVMKGNSLKLLYCTHIRSNYFLPFDTTTDIDNWICGNKCIQTWVYPGDKYQIYIHITLTYRSHMTECHATLCPCLKTFYPPSYLYSL